MLAWEPPIALTRSVTRSSPGARRRRISRRIRSEKPRKSLAAKAVSLMSVVGIGRSYRFKPITSVRADQTEAWLEASFSSRDASVPRRHLTVGSWCLVPAAERHDQTRISYQFGYGHHGRRKSSRAVPATIGPQRTGRAVVQASDVIATWLPGALFALVAWSIQRLLSKVALTTLGTRKFYLLSAVVSLIVYTPYLIWRPPPLAELLPALGLACLMAVTFGVTTEAIRRGPLGAVSPITALSPTITATLAVALLGERLAPLPYLGVALAPVGIVLISLGPTNAKGGQGWLALAILSLILQGIGAFIAKLVVSPAGPSALLLMGATVQVVVGLFLAPLRTWSAADFKGRPAVLTIIAYAIGGIATIGYLLALASGPAAAVVPLVATSPALAGLLGIVVLKEKNNRRQWAGIALALCGAVLLSLTG